MRKIYLGREKRGGVGELNRLAALENQFTDTGLGREAEEKFNGVDNVSDGDLLFRRDFGVAGHVGVDKPWTEGGDVDAILRKLGKERVVEPHEGKF